MKVIKATQQMLETRTLVIGFQGENLRTQLRIDCASTFAEYPNATPALAIKPPSGETYPVFVERDGNEVVWDIVANNLILKGDGELQLTFYKDNVIAKTVIGTIRVNRSLQIDGEMPDVVATWIENANRKLAEVDAQIVELEEMVDTATDAAERAEQSASTASTKAEQAAGSAATATAKATEATNAAGTATAKAAEAQLQAQYAINSAQSSAESERIATAKAGEATTAAGTATAKAEQATEAAETATEKAGDASESATAAHASEINAAESADDALSAEVGANAAKTAAETSATQAATSAQGASQDAQTATQKAAEASQSATNAATSAGTATTKAEEAAASAQAASEAKTAVEQTAEQLADSLEQIDQNTQDIAELDERKANIDGYYPDMTVGNAEQLNSSKYVENSEPYTLRTSGGTADIGNREYVDAVVGGTLAWNQAVRDEASENSTDFADVVTVTDAVEDSAGVKVKLEPAQDLHGYDHPWPAGGGKNLFNPTASAFAVSDLYHGQLIGAGNGESVALSLTDKGNNADISGVYLGLSGNGINSSDGIFWLISNGNVNMLSNVRTNMPYVTIYGNLENTLAKILARFNVQAELATAPTAWSPYENICPITGWDGVKVTRAGKNLCEKPTEENVVFRNGGYMFTLAFSQSGEITWTINVNAATYFMIKGFEIEGVHVGKTVTMSFASDVGVDSFTGFGFYNPETAQRTFPGESKRTLEITSDMVGLYLCVRFYKGNAEGQTIDISNIQIELGSTATAYEPYAGQTYSITLPTEAGTVYGGELTVNADGSGSLVVDRASVDFASINWSRDTTENQNGTVFTANATVPFIGWGNGGHEFALSNALVKASTTGSQGLENSNTFWWNTARTGYRAVWGKPNKGSTIEDFNTFLSSNNVVVVGRLATPITYTLTASQIRTLLGTNNVWSDAGQTALTYTGTDEHLVLESGKKYLARISGTDSMLLGSGQEITAAKGTDNVFDLTQMFGTAVADYVYGQGTSFFRKWFPNAVYPYNAGELKHVEGLQSHDMVGFNLWDEEWEQGRLDPNGNKVSGTHWLASKNYIRVVPNTQYCLSFSDRYRNTTSSAVQICMYDENKDFLARTSFSPTTQLSVTFTTSPKTKYVKFSIGDYSDVRIVDAYHNDICLNLSHSGARNGEYEPYEKHSYPLDSTVVLRGIPKVDANGVYWDGDRYLPDGTVERRYGVVDLGSLNWSRAQLGSSGFYFFYSGMYSLENKPKYLASGLTSNCYTVSVSGAGTAWNYEDRTLVIGNSSTYPVAYIRDDSFTDASAFTAAMQGVLLVYELATPTTETAQSYHSTQWVSDWGTEEFVSTGIVPVGHETRYPANLRDKLQHLPDAASGNGSYLITQTDGQMVLTPFPAPPSTAGNYVLKATVTNGVATYTWEAAT